MEHTWSAPTWKTYRTTVQIIYVEPRENEAGGRYGNGIITRNYKMNQVITIKVQIDSNHMGYFEFNLCANNDPKKIATPECFQKHLLQKADGSGARYTIPFRETKVYSF